MSGELRSVLEQLARERAIAVAVSGGVDSLTLMAFADAVVPASSLTAFHAVSLAVPPAATQRVRDLAGARGWTLHVVDAGETSDPAYLANPVDRCRVCKTHLYETLGTETVNAGAVILSGANVDDLSDYRPGLNAAKARGVRHPFIEAGMDKAAVRALARELGLHDVAELPAQPCLSSRIETGIAIRAPLLAMVNEVEENVRARVGVKATVRCRVRKSGVVIELDERVLARLDERSRGELIDHARPLVRHAGMADLIALEPYRMGSAFLRVLS